MNKKTIIKEPELDLSYSSNDVTPKKSIKYITFHNTNPSVRYVIDFLYKTIAWDKVKNDIYNISFYNYSKNSYGIAYKNKLLGFFISKNEIKDKELISFGWKINECKDA